MRATPAAEGGSHTVSPPHPQLLPTATAATTTTSGVSFANVVGSGKVQVAGAKEKGVSVQEAWGGKVGVVKSAGTAGGGGSGVGSGGWVSTGDAVALQYEKARKEAAELAR